MSVRRHIGESGLSEKLTICIRKSGLLLSLKLELAMIIGELIISLANIDLNVKVYSLAVCLIHWW